MDTEDSDPVLTQMTRYVLQHPGQESYTFVVPDAEPEQEKMLRDAGAQLAQILKVPVIIQIPDK